jgi:hypothetical protein
MASAMIDHNYNKSAVFKLIFSAGSELHGATAPFLMSSNTDFTDANNKTIADIMSRYWISFTVSGDPNPLRSPNAPFWPSYAAGGAGNMSDGESIGFDTLAVTYTTVQVDKDPDAGARCDFFASHGYQVSN